MIQIKVKNPLFRSALMQALAEFNPVIWEKEASPDDILLICMEQEEVDSFIETSPSGALVLLGTHHPEADLEIALPCVLNELKEQLNYLIIKRQNAPKYENEIFLFEGSKRLIINKKTQTQIGLTEKETELISYLVKTAPQAVSKSDLLDTVWNYKPDTETHTVETHIYALRQKLGEAYFDALILSVPEGYKLVAD